MVIDASVWVAALLTHDAHHAEAAAFLNRLVEHNISAAAPLLALPEVAGAIARQSNDTGAAENAARFLAAQAWVQFAPLNEALTKEAATVAAGQRLRGADAVYVALSANDDGVLVTLDREMLKRAAPSATAMSPIDWLEHSL